MQNQNTIKFKDIPFIVWLFGLLFLGAGVYYSFQGLTWHVVVLGVIGLAFLLLPRGLTITADRNTRILRLEYWTIYFLRTSKEIDFDDIATIRVASMRSSSHRGGGSRTYRVEAMCKDGSVIPFRSAYSSGSFGKQRIANGLRAFIGLGEALDETPLGLFRAVTKAATFDAEEKQQALTGPNADVRVTNGVHWTLQSRSMGASPVTRWHSPDFKMRDGFLFLAQKVGGQSSGGLMGAISKPLFQQTIALYGFRGDDTPNISVAEPLAPAPPLIDFHFMAFTNNQHESRQILNPWAQNPLAEWGQRYPLKQVQFGGGFSQLVVLFSPNGVYLATLGLLQPEQVEELTALGVEMVKTQGVLAS